MFSSKEGELPVVCLLWFYTTQYDIDVLSDATIYHNFWICCDIYDLQFSMI